MCKRRSQCTPKGKKERCVCEGEKGAVRVQKEAPVHTEGEKGAVRVQKEAAVHTEGEDGRRRQSKKEASEEKEAAGKGSFLEMF